MISAPVFPAFLCRVSDTTWDHSDRRYSAGNWRRLPGPCAHCFPDSLDHSASTLFHVLRQTIPDVWRGIFCLLLIPLLLATMIHAVKAQDRPEVVQRSFQNLKFTVLDWMGIPIANVLIADEKGQMQYRTDSNGIVQTLCHLDDCVGLAFDIRASGYKFVTVTVPAECDGNVRVFLESAGRSRPVGGNTTSVMELSQQRQARLASLQRAIAHAILLRDLDHAEDMLREALGLNPSAAWIANDLGIVALQRNRLEEAEAWFDKAAASAPFNPDIIGNCGIIRWLLNRPDESHALLNRAASLGFKSDLGFYVHGILALGDGEFQDARDNLLRTSTDRHPNRDLYLSIVWRKLGNARAAANSFANYLRRHRVPLLACDLSRLSIEISRRGSSGIFSMSRAAAVKIP